MKTQRNAVLMAILGGMLAACGGGQEQGGPTAAQKASLAAAVAAPAPTPAPDCKPYVAGASYSAGQVVSHASGNYICSVAGWCSSGHAAYEPGVGWAWQQAWSAAGPEACVTPTPVPTPTPPTPTPTPVPPTPTPTPPTPTPAPTPCRPDGLISSVASVPYCKVYDANGREILANGLNRRIIGYFTSWRTGVDGSPTYLVNNLPWDKITHVNYAFASVDPATFKIAIGSGANNPETGLTWPGVPAAAMDPSLPYQGHFNLLAQYKKKNPAVKVMVSVGGWAASTGFYTATTNADGSLNSAGINTLADSMVAFLRQYTFFDGIDIDYEHPTTNAEAGNPLDFGLSKPRLHGLMASYNVLLKTVRQKLDAAAVADNKYYLLTIAGSASGWVLRGEENMSGLQYLDYASLMSYDLHGGWNQYVGPNAALFDDGNDAELKAGNAYQYQNIGYLNTDWAYRYYRGALQAGRINIGVPYYTRGWKDVNGGSNGLWGTTAVVNSPVTCARVKTCGTGATGIDNVWFDLDSEGKPVPGGGNPLWHALNLQNGIVPDYLDAYKVSDKTLVGTYAPFYSSTMVAPWLWNATKKVFISTETTQSIGAKAQYIINNQIGGVMIWEMAGDYAWDATKNGGKGQYGMGYTLTNTLYEALRTAGPYGNKRAEGEVPAMTANVSITLGSWKPGDSNYPINPVMTVKNNSSLVLQGGTVFEFDYPVSAPSDLSDQSGFGLKTIVAGYTGPNNIGGFKANFNRARFALPSWQTLAPGASVALTLNYRLPISGPSNYTVTLSGVKYALPQEHPELPVGVR
ncbi:chitinase C-terminal domain-containing protein [Janthinobacterium fluminis]|uniref:Glycosyl hydrolase family 18 protein n=1 Tax=Janthinobacterium fluminis TaxID=2987524 RepID=A0ABT5K6X8_9BURK|nr:glycosyl hydrolase family 18 protein [Janthinobacterium fluminis]MDC8760168.1 glycosyl hydrolase family 18 protein [Janthinobacterium fluminis]